MATKHYQGYRARWLDENRRRQSATFPNKASATYCERKKKVEVAEIRRGLRSPIQPDKTFDDIAGYWNRYKVPRKRSGADDASIIKNHLLPAFGERKLRLLSEQDFDGYLADRVHLSDKTLLNHLALLKAMLRLAHRLRQNGVRWLADVPEIPMPKVRVFDADYRYLRTRDELTRFLLAAQQTSPLVFAFYAAALFTGMRAGEIAGLQWADVDFATRLITVQRSWNGPTKAGDVRYVPLLSPLLSILRPWKLANPGGLVFTNIAGNMFDKSARIFQEALHRTLKAAGLPEVERNGKKRPYLRFHDLRHTFASHWMMSGGCIFKLQRILGHKSAAMTQRYSHLSLGAFAADLDRLGVDAPGALAEVIELPVRKTS